MTTVKEMMAAANAAVPKITPDEAWSLMPQANVLVVDVRDAPEVEKSGKVAGAVHVSRGMLEFRADPESPLLRFRRPLGARRQGADGPRL
jgi:rhodanese-related sulfurtransferase